MYTYTRTHTHTHMRIHTRMGMSTPGAERVYIHTSRIGMSTPGGERAAMTGSTSSFGGSSAGNSTGNSGTRRVLKISVIEARHLTLDETVRWVYA